MKQNTLRFIFAPVFVCLFSFVSSAQLDENGQWKTDLRNEPIQLNYKLYSESDFNNTLAKLELIKAESVSLQINEWAGEYDWHDDTYQSVFRWSPNAGFVSIGISTCQPELRTLDYGSITATPEYVTTVSAKQKGQNVKYIPVKWGERHYLMLENELASFRDYAAGYGSAFDANLFPKIRNGDEEKPVADTPTYPRGYERFIKKPIDAVITKILKREIKAEKLDDDSFDYNSETTVKLNVGSADGVKREMMFNFPNSRFNETIEIIGVSKNSSTGFISRGLDGNKKETRKNYQTKEIETLPPIQEGMNLSTRPIFQ